MRAEGRWAAGSLSPEYGCPHEHAPGWGQTPATEYQLLWEPADDGATTARTQRTDAHELDAAAGGWRTHTRGGALCGGAAHAPCKRRMPLTEQGRVCTRCIWRRRRLRRCGRRDRDRDRGQLGRPPPASSIETALFTGKTKSKTHSKTAHYRFPVSIEDGAAPTSSPHPQLERERERQRNVTVSLCSGGGSARARDGGWTQSGGVRGLLTED
ncbi:hypothetical protein C8R44DRAFT_818890 [Mycena epipterygia]|nr:hypothetical protein C8R44DRAFT_818890 [Mycena epipterygia]